MPKRIVVPLDGTPVGEAVLPEVAEIARALGAEVILLHVVPPRFVGSGQRGRARMAPPSGLVGAPSVLPAYSPSSTVLAYRYDPAEIEATGRYVERLAAWLRDQGLLSHALVVEGPDVASAVLREAAGADLLALAVSGGQPRRFGRSVYGPISERLLHECPIPILLVRVPYAAG